MCLFNRGKQYTALENTQHFPTPPLNSPQIDIWEMKAETPHRWHITTQCFWLVVLPGKFASTDHKHYPQILVVIHHQCRISALVSQRSFHGETGITKIMSAVFSGLSLQTFFQLTCSRGFTDILMFYLWIVLMRLKTRYHGAPLKLLFIPPQTHLFLNWILHRGVKLDSNLRNLLVNGANGCACPKLANPRISLISWACLSKARL